MTMPRLWYVDISGNGLAERQTAMVSDKEESGSAVVVITVVAAATVVGVVVVFC